MTEGLDIHSLLETGYFTTSRARGAQSPEKPAYRSPSPPPSRFIPSYEDAVPRRYEPVSRTRARSDWPPPPSVEDEDVSLMREHGSPRNPTVADEEPQSRGDVDQQPVILEVHEHNPERRFVILSEAEKAQEKAKEADAEAAAAAIAAASSQSSRRDRRDSRAPPRDRSPDSAGGRDRDLDRSSRDPRRSRQDLPPIDTGRAPDRQSAHHRTRSTTGGAPPDYFTKRESRHGDTLLSPDFVKHGTGRRDTAYHSTGKAPRNGDRSPVTRTSSTFTDFRPHDEGHDRKAAAHNTVDRRSSSNAESGRSRRRYSVDGRSDTRHREEYPPRANTRGASREERVSGTSRRRSRSRATSREGSRSSDEYVHTSSRGAGRRRAKSIIVQDERESAPRVDSDRASARDSRPPPPVNSFPPPSPKPSNMPDEFMKPRGPSIPPTIEDDRVARERAATTNLPYPDDDLPRIAPRIIPDMQWSSSSAAARAVPPATMAYLAMQNPSASDPTLGTSAPEPTGIPRMGSGWQPPPLDHEKRGATLERPAMGSVRRFSENNGSESPGGDLPECPRIEPVAGMMDWLTLPRTDFNICPQCYEHVFAHTEYRTQFQPMLRPTDKPLSCDFGLSPWYRIAWLLTLKNRSPDLRIFHAIANVSTMSRTQPCPGTRRTTRNWYTVRNPEARRPIREFTVCYQCAKTVEALLPNLTGIFGPLDSRAEPVRSVCALHFTPERKRFVMYFDALETVSDDALAANQAPDMGSLAVSLEKLSVSQCREDSPIPDGYWHNMQYLPEFTVCSQCFEEVVSPKLNGESVIARNFYTKRQKLPMATCQLYSPRMRDIFRKACARNDPKYLEEKVRQRQKIESDIQAQLMKLDREGLDEEWTEEQVTKLIREWEKWE